MLLNIIKRVVIFFGKISDGIADGIIYIVHQVAGFNINDLIKYAWYMKSKCILLHHFICRLYFFRS